MTVSPLHFALVFALFFQAGLAQVTVGGAAALVEDLAQLGNIPLCQNDLGCNPFLTALAACEDGGFQTSCFCTPDFQAEMLGCSICIDGAYVATDNPARAQSKYDYDTFSDFCFNVTVYSSQLTLLPSTAFTGSLPPATATATGSSSFSGGGGGNGTSSTVSSSASHSATAIIATSASTVKNATSTAASAAAAATSTKATTSSAGSHSVGIVLSLLLIPAVGLLWD